MKYRDLIRSIKDSAGTDDDSSQDALEIVVENVAVHLTDTTRRDFAAMLPHELQSAAMMVPTATHIDEDIIEQLMELEDVDEGAAKRHIIAAWQSIRDLFSNDEVTDITDELPRRVVAALE